MQIYGLIEDSGDGSSVIRWFKNKKIALYLIDNDELYYANGCNINETLDFPDSMDLEKCGFQFSDQYHMDALEKDIKD